MSRYDEYQEPGSGGVGSGGKTAIGIIVIVVGGGLLAVAVCCGGIVYLYTVMFKSMENMMDNMQEEMRRQQEEGKRREEQLQQSQRFVRSFVDDIQANRLDRAYAGTSARYQKRFSEKEFEDLIRANPVLQDKKQTVDLKGTVVSNDNHKYQYTLSQPSEKQDKPEPGVPPKPKPAGQLEVTLSLVRQGDDWHVDEITVVKK